MERQLALDATHWVEVRCAFLPDTLWVVPTDAEARELAADGIAVGRIWTHQEILTLYAQHPTREQVEFTARAKLFFDGDVVPAT